MADARIRVEYRDSARNRPTLRFSIPSKLLLNHFIGMFRSLAEGPEIVKLSDLPFIELDSIREIELIYIGDRKEPPEDCSPASAGRSFGGFMTRRVGFGALSLRRHLSIRVTNISTTVRTMMWI